MSISYYYFGGRIPSNTGQQPANSSTPPSLSTNGNISELEDEVDNPIFNFSPDFIQNVRSVSSIDLAGSVPVISLSIVDNSGNVLKNFTTDVFQKSFDPSLLSTDTRDGDRPEASLENVTLQTTNASGYLTFTNVTINIKIHRPSVIVNEGLLSLLFPGMNFILEYGASCATNEFLSKTEKLYFSLKTYNLSFDQYGQANLTLEGMTFNDRLNTVFVGDSSTVDSSETEDQAIAKDGLYNALNQTQSYVKYIQNQLSSPGHSNQSDYTILKNLLQVYQPREQRIRGAIRKNFTSAFQKLKNVKQNGSVFLEGFVTFHDFIYTMCDDTLSSFHDAILPAGTNFRFIYGSFDSNVGKNNGTDSGLSATSAYSNASVADFKLDYRELKTILIKEAEKGSTVPTIQGLIDVVIERFLNNEQYWRMLEGTLNKPYNGGINTPNIVMNFTNFTTSDSSQSGGKQTYVDISIFDVKKDLPLTSKTIFNIAGSKGFSSQQDFQDQCIGSPATIPVLKVGSANSFIKSINLSSNTDPQIKAAYIVSMSQNRGNTTREYIPPELIMNVDQTAIPPILPIVGEMTLLGHVDWKINRAFFLSTGLYIIDAVYSILSVTHTLSRDGFETKISFIYN